MITFGFCIWGDRESIINIIEESGKHIEIFILGERTQ